MLLLKGKPRTLCGVEDKDCEIVETLTIPCPPTMFFCEMGSGTHCLGGDIRVLFPGILSQILATCDLSDGQ